MNRRDAQKSAEKIGEAVEVGALDDPKLVGEGLAPPAPSPLFRGRCRRTVTDEVFHRIVLASLKREVAFAERYAKQMTEGILVA